MWVHPPRRFDKSHKVSDAHIFSKVRYTITLKTPFQKEEEERQQQ